MLGGGPPGAPGTGAPGAVGALGEEEDSGSDIAVETEKDESDHFSYLLNEDNICPIVSKTQVNLLYRNGEGFSLPEILDFFEL